MVEPENADVGTVFVRSVEEFQARVRAVGAAPAWTRPTPCPDWDVRALVSHIVGEQRWAIPLVAGKTVADVGAALDGDLLGPAPQEASQAAAEAAVAAFAEPGAMDRTVHLSFGDFSAADYAWQLAADHLVHAWDLAVAVGADPQLDPDLVAQVARWWEQWEALYRGAGVVAEPVTVGADASDQDRLLGAFGRDPRWGQ